MTVDFTRQRADLIAQVRPGMRVLDRDGEKIGGVALVKMGGLEAVTPRGQELDRGEGWLTDLAEAGGGGEPDVAPRAARRLMRTGFIKVDSGGVFGRNLYTGPNGVADVAGDDVHLGVTRRRLVTEN